MSETTQPTTQKIYYDPISVAQRTPQKLYHVAPSDKTAMLTHIIQNTKDIRLIVMTKTKRMADTLATHLNSLEITATSVHGSKRTQEIEAATLAFNEGELAVIITTDMILQSLKLDNITHLISYDLPSEPDHYLNRMVCLKEVGEAIVLISEDQEVELLDIERVMRHEISEAQLEGFEPAPFSVDTVMPKSRDKKKKPRHRKKKSKKATNSETTEK